MQILSGSCVLKIQEENKRIPPMIHHVEQIFELITRRCVLKKYSNTRNTIVTVSINNISIPNTLIDIGSTTNMMTEHTLEKLQLNHLLHPTPIVLELVDRSTIKPIGVLDDITIIFSSWEYPVDFMIIQ